MAFIELNNESEDIMAYVWNTNDYQNFKKLLAILVAVRDKNEGIDKPRGEALLKKGITTCGQGYNGGTIQEHIADCCTYKDGKICISSSKGSHAISYLHFKNTPVNIEFDKDSNDSSGNKNAFCIKIKDDKDYKGVTYTFEDLNLFDDKSFKEYSNKEYSNDEKIKEFLDKYYNCYKEYCMNEYIDLLEEKKNIILQGAPGTGKTYSVDGIIEALCGKKRSEIEFIFTKNAPEGKEYKGQVAFCTFHQSMEYEDFIEGIKPVIDTDGKVTYSVEKGIFWHIANAAIKDDKNKYVLVIDEINRGNVSKIFGELITLLEAGKRKGAEQPISVTLPYSKEKFELPSNLYIIGTMNTTDRSVGNLDYAIRRRFAFVTMKTNPGVVNEYFDSKDENLKNNALAIFDQINDKGGFIERHKIDADMDLEDLKIGHSYFMADTPEKLKMKMKYEVIPLIKEYMKDGLLSSDKNDEKYFNAWMNGEAYEEKTTKKTEVNTEEKTENDSGKTR